MKIFVPPIKCQGIKTKLVEWIADHVELNDNGLWIEPFTGSGVVGFNIRPKRALFSDINPHIINFYNSVKNNHITPDKVKSFLEHEGELLSKKGGDHFYEVRSRFNKYGEPLDFLFLSRASFNGVIRFNKKGGYNVPFGHKEERFAKAYITKITNQLKYVSSAIKQYDWTFVCADFRTLIPSATKDDFLYCDPPYAGRHTDYFNSWSDKEEDDLYTLLASTSAKFILSTWHSNQYRKNLSLEKYIDAFNILTREHFYHVGASEENRNPMLEAIVLNYNTQPLDLHIPEHSEQLIQMQLLEKTVEYNES
jgi:DNA adenine methylase